MDYRTLNAKPAAAFLDPEGFRTTFDKPGSAYAAEQYAKGLDTGRNAKEITISQGTTWGAAMKSGGMLCAYEGIGYHACTADLLRGFLDSGAPIVVYRGYGPDAGKTVRIK